MDVGGYAYRSTIAIMSGETFVPFRRSHREAADVRAGATVRVTLTLDTEVRDVAVPDYLSDALAGAGLREAWDRLSVTAGASRSRDSKAPGVPIPARVALPPRSRRCAAAERTTPPERQGPPSPAEERPLCSARAGADQNLNLIAPRYAWLRTSLRSSVVSALTDSSNVSVE